MFFTNLVQLFFPQQYAPLIAEICNTVLGRHPSVITVLNY